MIETLPFYDYELISFLKVSKGTRVLLVQNRSTGERRVIKEIQKNAADTESAHSEACILKSLAIQGIPKMYERKESKQYVYIMEEYIPGESLAEFVRRGGISSWQRAADIMLRLTEIVGQLHHHKPEGILHLDLQPGNVMIREGGIFLIDFGNAVFLNQGSRMYRKGTPGFAAPEQYSGAPVDERTDIYGLGACFAYLLTGTGGESAIPGAPARYRRLLRDCMERNPDERIRDTGILYERLRELSGEFKEQRKESRNDNYRKNKEGSKAEMKTGFLQHRREEYDKRRLLVGIMGTGAGEGVTSLVIGLGAYLRKKRGWRVALAEMNESSAFAKIRQAYYGSGYEKNPFEIMKVTYCERAAGTYYTKLCNMEYDCVIADFGADHGRGMEDFLHCDRKIVLASANLWKYEQYLQFHARICEIPGVENWLFLMTGDKEDLDMLRKKHGLNIGEHRYYSNPYQVGKEGEEYYEQVIGGKTIWQ